MTLTETPRRKKAPSSAQESDQAIAGAKSSPGRRFMRHVVLCAIGLVMMYPLLWMVSSSLKVSNTVFTDEGLWPKAFDPTNYPRGWNALNDSFTLYLTNSAVIVTISIIGNLFSCSLAAFAFARLQFKFRGLFFAIMLGTLMLPAHVLVIPRYVLFDKLEWLNTYYPLLVPHFLATNGFYIFLMVQFMRALPSELDDAARIDGCGPFRTFWKVIMPLCMPAFATTAIFTFISVWNEFFEPLLYLTDPQLYTVPLAVRQFMDSEGQSMWGEMFAMSFISLAPVIGFFIAGQKYLVKGIATTGLK
jgi:pectin-derived oligosaccharide transport system permease protein